MSQELAYVKLISGEYVLGRVEHKDEETIVLKKPLSVNFEMMLGGLQMVPYDAYYLNKEVQEAIFKIEHTLHIHEGSDVPKELEEKYNEFASGIIQPGQAQSGMQEAQAMQMMNQLLGAGGANQEPANIITK